ncbi:MAG: hypothetical protein WC528_03835 [Patescibacteria group bacterium]
MVFYKRDKTTQKLVLVGVRQVNGNIMAIEYLQNSDPKYIDGLFFFAKRYGRATFEWEGDVYEIIRNRNITYTVNKLGSEVEKEIMEFR